ncbi:MAG: methyl-accepting chemotaxis protein, partial [Deltaproteobacteria bacterium]
MQNRITKNIFERSTDSRLQETGVVVLEKEERLKAEEIVKKDKNLEAENRDREEKKQNGEKRTMSTQGIGSEVIKAVLDLVRATKEGRLDTRADLTGVEGAERELLVGINELIDAFVGPINVTAEYVARISKGDIPEKITDTYNGDFNEIKNNLNAVIDIMNGLLDETGKLIDATIEGKLDTRGDAAAFGGGWGKLVGGINNLIDAFVGPINVTADYVERISEGDIPEKITDT